MRNSSASDASGSAVTAVPLLALVNATAEWQAGVPHVCSAGVRLLDRVHFTVHRGDCVLVHHDDPAGARVLLAALSGHPALPPGRRLLGERQCAVGVRIRRCSIPLDAVAALQAGWQHDPGRRVPSSALYGGGTPVVHLLRASRRTPVTAAERAQWRGWAHSVRLRDGALVIVAPPEPRPAITTPVPPPVSDTMRERAAPPYDVVAAAVPTRQRAVWLHHGRLFNLRTWE